MSKMSKAKPKKRRPRTAVVCGVKVPLQPVRGKGTLPTSTLRKMVAYMISHPHPAGS